MESATLREPVKAKIFLCLILTLKGLSSSPHTPFKVTWIISSLRTGKVINSTEQTGLLSEVFPDLYFDLCTIMDSDDVCISKDGVYACPGTGRTRNEVRNCGGPEVGFCAAWGCETAGTVYWKPGTPEELIRIREVPGTKLPPGHCAGKDCGKCLNGTKGRCHPLIINFTQTGKRADWATPMMWGVRVYRSGQDPVALFTITRQIQPISPLSVGPNPVLADQQVPSRGFPEPASLESATQSLNNLELEKPNAKFRLNITHKTGD